MEPKTIFSNKAYDILKWAAAFFLPAAATLVETVFPVWGIPYGHEIAITIIAVDTFLGGLLGISSIQYNKSNNED